MEKIAINERELAIINAFCGYGSLQSADIIFLGSEEGHICSESDIFNLFQTQ